MFYINEWRPKYPAQLLCGHTVPADQKAYKLMLAVCQDDIACFPQAIRAALRVQQEQKPSLLYRLWHWCFGTRRKPAQASPNVSKHRTPAVERKVKPMPQVRRYTAKALRGLHLDCGHHIKTGETLVVTSVYTCEKERNQPLAILLAWLQFCAQQAQSQPVAAKPAQTTHTVYTYQPRT